MRQQFHVRVLAALFGMASLSGACSPRPEFMPGNECDLNSDCAESLVCRLGRCRVDCRVDRDCGAGVLCLADEEGLRGCALPRDQECTLSSDCTDPLLVCHFQTCTNACDDDRDCPAGSRCVSDDSGMGCRDMSTDQCTLNSDCAAPFVCAVDGVCREECRGDRDCRDGKVCLPTSPRICGHPSPDGGVDAGPRDAGPIDAGPIDAGPDDAGPTDAGDPGPVGPPPPPLLAAGLGHTCAAPTPNDLRCWGRNTDGQLGNGATAPVSGTSRIASLDAVSRVAAGARHTCAIHSGTVHCWGLNSDGQLGVTGVHRSPAAVSLPATATDLTCGNAHTCAIAGARVYCWGLNSDGQLGQPMGTASSGTPVEVTGLSGTPVEVASFSNHTCVRMSDGTVDCFGNNDFGQLGVTSPSAIYAPHTVSGLSGVVQIQTGTTHTCALSNTGQARCWGLNSNGQLGRMGGGSAVPTPTAGPDMPLLELGLGSTHSCARTAGGVVCWGANLFQQAGHDGGSNTFMPIAHADLGAVRSVRAGTSHTCVWVTDTDVRCFGRNDANQLTGMPGGPPDSTTPLGVTW